MSDQQKLNSIWYDSKPVPLKYKFLSKVFSVVSKTRKKLYDSGVIKTEKIKCPVIVVGNITVGGVGKTPFVIWLVNQLQQQGYNVGVISRGYGGKRVQEPLFVTPQTSAKASGDEPLLISKHTHAKVMVGKDKVKAAKALVADYRVNVIVSDDGLQHYKLARDFEICLIDAEKGFGNEKMLPAGPMREPKQRLESVNMKIFKGEKQDEIYFTYEPFLVYKLGKIRTQHPISKFRSRKIHAVAGIAHPNSFFEMLSNHGLAVIKHPLNDHQDITIEDLTFNDVNLVFITEKDAVKCKDIRMDNVWVVVIRLLISNEHKEQVLAKVLEAIK